MRDLPRIMLLLFFKGCIKGEFYHAMAKKETIPVVKKRALKSEIADKKELAKLLFTRNNVSQKDLAARVGVSPQTICNWIKDELWDDLRKSLLISKDEQLRSFYNQIDNLNKAIENRPDGFRYATSKEADVQAKTTASIRNLETETNVAQTIEVAREFINWVRPEDLEQAKLITRLFDAFIKEKLKRK